MTGTATGLITLEMMCFKIDPRSLMMPCVEMSLFLTVTHIGVLPQKRDLTFETQTEQGSAHVFFPN